MNKHKYFEEYWQERLNGLDSQKSMILLSSPRLVLRELEEEIKLNNLSNSKNKNLLFDEINKLYNSKLPALTSISKNLSLIRREFEKPRKSYLAYLCKETINIFKSYSFFNACVDNLCALLFDEDYRNKEIQKDEIKKIVTLLISELVEDGYSAEYIKKIPNILQSKYTDINGYLISSFPHNIKPLERDYTNVELEEYNKKLRIAIDSLTPKKRIEALKTIISSPMETFIFIFQIKGLRGDVSFDLGNVKFYNPKTNPIILKKDELHDETFGGKENIFINASVSLKTKDMQSGLIKAKEQISHSLDCLAFIFAPQTPFEISTSYISLFENNSLAGFGSGEFLSDPIAYHRSLVLSDDQLNNSRFSIIREYYNDVLRKDIIENEIDRRVKESLHWYRKAIETSNNIDKLLWHWISIENLFRKDSSSQENFILPQKENESPINLALELLPRIKAKNNIYSKGWLARNVINIYIKNPANQIGISDEIICKLRLDNSYGKIYFSDFLTHLKELKDYLQKLEDVYSSSEKTIEELLNDKERFHNELILLYRMRNKIVHNANFTSTLLPLYSEACASFSRTMIDTTIIKRQTYGILNFPNLFSSIFLDFELFIEELKIKSFSDIV